MSQRQPILPGYVTIDAQVVAESGRPEKVTVLGKQWSRDYGVALELAGRLDGLVAARHWVSLRNGNDPVAELSLVEVEPKKGGRK